MFRYTTYLLVSTLKKKTTTLIPLLFSIFFGTLLILQAKNNNLPVPTLSNLPDPSYYVPFLFTSLYVGIKAINVFKDGVEDGSELLIISRPLPRMKIIVGKFLVMFFHILFFTFIVFITSVIASQSDVPKSSRAQAMEFSLSLTTGTLIICLLISMIIILIASVTTRLGTMISVAIVPFLLIVFSAIVPRIAKGDVRNFTRERYVYSKKDNTKNLAGLSIPTKNYNEYKKKPFERQEDGWYNRVKYFDVFTQMKSFYKILLPETTSRISKLKHSNFKVDDSLTDVYLHGKDLSNNDVQFTYAPLMKRSDLLVRRMHHIFSDNQKLLTETMYQFIVNNYKVPTTSMKKEHRQNIENINKLINPAAFDVSNPDSLKENNIQIRAWNNMGTAILYFLHNFNETLPAEQAKKINLFIKSLNIPAAHPKTLMDAIEFLRVQFITSTSERAIIPITMFMSISQKIHHQQEILKATDKKSIEAAKLITPKERVLLNDYKKLIIDGKYTVNKKDAKPVNVYTIVNGYGIFKKGDKVPYISYEPWVSRSQVYGIWISLMIIFWALTIFRYFKQDFK